jgi:cytochrome c oxidase subunit 3/cytochrome o ubiquinol oxidase subunit 3
MPRTLGEFGYEREHAQADIGNLTASQVGMIAFLASEVAFFSTLIVAYLTFLGKDAVGPTPREALSLPLALASTFFLLASSATIHQAERSLHRGSSRMFALWWGATILLGAIFLAGTAYEWSELIREHHLTISRNLFGTTYYTLVGFHALHVTCGLIAMAIVLGLALRGRASPRPGGSVQLVGWYWHFVDAVWIVVFSIVYLLSTLG